MFILLRNCDVIALYCDQGILYFVHSLEPDDDVIRCVCVIDGRWMKGWNLYVSFDTGDDVQGQLSIS